MPITKEEISETWKRAKANIAALNGCDGHVFEDTKTGNVLDKRWQCTKCHGEVHTAEKTFYEQGLAHGAAKVADPDKMFERGERAAYAKLLGVAVSALYPAADMKLERLVLEREDTVRALRRVCEDHGSNEWEPDTNLGNVIDKHLAPHVGEDEGYPDSRDGQDT